jgi:hypothetical protein
MRAVASVCGAIALVLAIGTGARADDWNKKTFFTFSGPVQIPGATLPAGTYTFKLADLSGSRHVVQVFDKAEKKIYATLMAIPDQRNKTTDDPIVVFAERPSGTPVAVKSWFYPGESIGNEFIYPKRQAMEIAKRTHESVLASTSDSEKVEKTTEVARVNDAGDTAQAPDTTSRRASEQPAPTTTSGTSGRTAAPTTTAPAARRELPRTASEWPLAALLSGFAIATGFGVRRARRRLERAA